MPAVAHPRPFSAVGAGCGRSRGTEQPAHHERGLGRRRERVPVAGDLEPGATPAAPGVSPWVPPQLGRGDMVVSVPTLVIWGERDRFLLSGNLNGLEAYVPNLTVKRIPEGSHWVLHERATEVNALIREFIR
jgi:pimeloyl-ACP methyl ester carboxylesterase